MSKMQITIIGAGSISFCPATIADIFLSKQLTEIDLKLVLMDISSQALLVSKKYVDEIAAKQGSRIEVIATTNLDMAVQGADFVITAIEKDRYHYWSQDFHMPRRYGFRQVYGENGGPGGMFHFLRNVGPMLEIVKAMEKYCPDAWLLNYTNPEAKLVEAISKLTSIKVVGLCHGEQMGVEQVAKFLEIPCKLIQVQACGLNHFGWFTKINHKETGEDLYPLLREKEKMAHWLSDWDEYALTRIMFRTYGLWSYPGANHIGEYIAWSDAFLASALIQYFHDPANENIWQERQPPEFVYSFAQNPTARKLFPEGKELKAADPGYTVRFDAERPLIQSSEYGIDIVEAIHFDKPIYIGAVNMLNKNYIPGVLPDMVVEVPAMVDGNGIHPLKTESLPTAITAMINQQGAIHELLIQAYREKSRNKLLQALLLDPTVSSYNQAVALLDDIQKLQFDILPELF